MVQNIYILVVKRVELELSFVELGSLHPNSLQNLLNLHLQLLVLNLGLTLLVIYFRPELPRSGLDLHAGIGVVADREIVVLLSL